MAQSYDKRSEESFNRTIQRISESVRGACLPKKTGFSRRHLERYLYTFSFQIGCDQPSDQVIKNIYSLMRGDEGGQSEGIQQNKFKLLIKICIGIYEESKRSAIGGIFDRVQVAVKQLLYYSKLDKQDESI